MGSEMCIRDSYQTLESFALKEALEEGQLEGSLKTVAQGLDEDDNPVIMVVRFRLIEFLRCPFYKKYPV